jgi:hypothetical protein
MDNSAERQPRTIKMRTISGELVAIPPAPTDRGRCVMALVRCRMRWVPEQDLMRGVIADDDEGGGTFGDAPTLASTDGEGNPVAIAVPYNCADEVFVLVTKDGYPEWQPRSQVYGPARG